MRVCVIGTGYVGLVAGACFSDTGNHVIGLDVDAEKVAKLSRGESPIFEPGLEELLARNMRGKRLSFTTDARMAIEPSSVIFIAVGTPQDERGAADLSYVKDAIRVVRDHIKQDTIVVMKSTVPVGTADLVRGILKGINVRVEVVSNPEFLKEGTAVNDFLKPERVIIGCQSDWARRTMSDLYAPFVRSGAPILMMSNRSAELSKYAANCFLATKISFINDVALLAEKVGADIHDVRRGIVADSRIGSKFLYPGCGYGGSCFPKDIQALIHLGREYDLPLNIFEAVHGTNERQKLIMFEKIKKHFKGNLKGRTVAIWGLSFKPQTDDMREAPAVTVVSHLLQEGAKVRAYDPVAMPEARKIWQQRIDLCQDAYEATHKADCLVIMTEWNEFRTPDFDLMKREMVNAVIFDGRNLYHPESLDHQGFVYYCVGKADPQ